MSRGAVIAVGALGLLWVLAFAPDPWAGATVPGVVSVLVVAERSESFRRAALLMIAFVAVGVGFGYRWLVPTVEAFGGLSTPAAIGVLILFAIAGTVHLLVFAGFYRLLFVRGVRPHPMATAALLVACELLPIRFFPWATGHGVVGVPPLRQLAEWGGVALVSFGTLCLVVPVHELAVAAFGRDGPPARLRGAVVTLLVGLGLAAAGWMRHGAVAEGERDAARRVRVAIVQANVGSGDKRRAEKVAGEEARRSREGHERLSRQAAAEGAALVVWPETALSGAGGRSVSLWDPVAGRARDPGVVAQDLRRLGYGWLEEVGRDRTFLVGGYEDEREKDTLAREARWTRYNVAMLREPGGAAWSLYRKVKLIPFGEWMPGERWFPGIGERFLPQTVPMEAGERDQPPLRWAAEGLTIVPFVCYEAILPDFVRERAGSAAPDLLVNLTNDSWFGDTWEPHQHLAFSRFRAVEHRRPLVRSTNTGISAFVTSNGDVVSTLGVGREGVLVHDVPVRADGRTLYATVGAWIPIAFWAAAILVVLASLVRPAAWEHQPPRRVVRRVGA